MNTEKLKAAAAHLALMTVPILLGWASADLLPWLQHDYPQWALIWAGVGKVLLWATPLTTRYGRGSAGQDGGQ